MVGNLVALGIFTMSEQDAGEYIVEHASDMAIRECRLLAALARGSQAGVFRNTLVGLAAESGLSCSSVRFGLADLAERGLVQVVSEFHPGRLGEVRLCIDGAPI